MYISQAGIDLIKQFEGVKLKAYLCPANVWTIGVGHTGRDVTEGLQISEERAEELLRADLMRFQDGVRKYAGACTQGQFDALVSFAFNIGITAMANSTLVKKHKAGEFREAADQFLRWTRGGGRILPGLVRRRNAERRLYLNG